ncbi:Serine/threonine-protein kinase PK-1 [termite gut metagenome]|uniref:Serine/threonine-protein kinase PK-1 n=1 Tax=termite gut metagenome TaxID=433724 RepID=A0A5J4QE96_9ZZZZ
MKKKTTFIILGNLLAMCLVAFLLIAGIMFWLDTYTRQGEVVVVPEIKGFPIADAEKYLYLKNLQCAISDSDYVKEKPVGSVLDYTPSAGQKVKKGRVIYLTINRYSVPECPVPDVTDNTSVRQAEARILAAGFRLATHEVINGERDWVYGVKYKGRKLTVGDKVPMEATLTLIVGSGTGGKDSSMEEGDVEEGYEYIPDE